MIDMKRIKLKKQIEGEPMLPGISEENEGSAVKVEESNEEVTNRLGVNPDSITRAMAHQQLHQAARNFLNNKDSENAEGYLAVLEQAVEMLDYANKKFGIRY